MFISNDVGEYWSLFEIINMFDVRVKLSVGNLFNGVVFIVNCLSGSKVWMLLVLSLSDNGNIFNWFFMLWNEVFNIFMCYEGKYKWVGFSYFKSWVIEDIFYVVYVENKEDIVVIKVLLSVLLNM